MLMLAILMGLSAWLMDAVISWHFFPGKTFLEMLWQYDPQRTLFARSAVVLLFFAFGLFAGYLLERLEEQKQIDGENIRFLEGIHSILDCSFTTLDPDEMLKQSTSLFRDTFQFEDVFVVRISPETRKVLSRHTTKPGEIDPADFKELEKAMLSANKPFKPSRSNRPFSNPSESADSEIDGVHVPLYFGDTLHGYVFGTWEPSSKHHVTKAWEEYFFSACKDIAKSIDHLLHVQESEQKAAEIKSLFDLSPMSIFVTTVSGKVIYLNPTLKMLLTGGASDESVANIPIQNWYENPKRLEECIHKLNRDGKVNDFEFQLKTIQGSLRTVIMSARLNRQVNSSDPHIEGFMLDITNRRSEESSKRKLQQELERAQHLRAITVLAGGVAHEFNNILQAMMGSAYLGKLKLLPDQEEVAHSFDDIQNSGKRAAKLCDQMLSYAGKRVISPKLELMDEVLEQILLIVQKDVSSTVDVHTSFGAPGVKSHLDFPSFSEIITNILENASESFKGDEDNKIELTTQVKDQTGLRKNTHTFTRELKEEEYWVLSIKDNGSGIAPENQPHIFEPFYTTKFQGRGLGLSAVSGIVEKLDGSIGLLSEVGVGTEILICLPKAESVVVIDDEEDAEESTTNSKDFALEKRQKIWVVDDEPLIGETVMRILTQTGFDVCTQQNSKEFLKEFTKEEAETTDCLLLDLTMPEVNGMDVVKAVRKHSPELPIMIMSGYDEREQLDNFKKYTIARFVHKPFRMNELVDAIKAVLST